MRNNETIKIGGRKVSLKSLDKGFLEKIKLADSADSDESSDNTDDNIYKSKLYGKSCNMKAWHLKRIKSCGAIQIKKFR